MLFNIICMLLFLSMEVVLKGIEIVFLDMANNMADLLLQDQAFES